MTDARENGHNAYLRYRHLVVDGRKYSVYDIRGNVNASEHMATTEMQVNSPQTNNVILEDRAAALIKEEKKEVLSSPECSLTLPHPLGTLHVPQWSSAAMVKRRKKK